MQVELITTGYHFHEDESCMGNLSGTQNQANRGRWFTEASKRASFCPWTSQRQKKREERKSPHESDGSVMVPCPQVSLVGERPVARPCATGREGWRSMGRSDLTLPVAGTAQAIRLRHRVLTRERRQSEGLLSLSQIGRLFSLSSLLFHHTICFG